MQWIDSGLNRRALVSLVAWIPLTSGAFKATKLGKTASAIIFVLAHV